MNLYFTKTFLSRIDINTISLFYMQKFHQIVRTVTIRKKPTTHKRHFDYHFKESFHIY